MTESYENLVEKYRAIKYSDFVNIDKAIIELKLFLQEFPKRKGIILHGPAGTGKTSLAIASAKESNLEIFELNASDLRNRKKLEEVLKPATLQLSLFKKGKIILMDEVDGVTGTDIGGIPELIRVLDESKFPIIMTCNDVWQSKLSQLRQKCRLVEMKALPIAVISSMLRKIGEKEGINKPIEFFNQLAIKSQGDLRAALNDLHSYAYETSIYVNVEEKRDTEDSIFNILRKLFKERNNFLNLFDYTKMSLDEILLWIEENIPKEYKNESLAKAYHSLGKADVFRGRIYKNQSWRFLIYQNIFQSAGISYAKKNSSPGFTKYETPKRVLKIWLSNQKIEKKKSIAKKYARYVHCSTKRVLRDFELLRPIITREDAQKQLKLTDEEIDFLKK